MRLYLTNDEKEKIRKLGVLKVNQVAHFLEVCPRTIQRFIQKGFLKANIFKFYKKRTLLIDAEEFIKFVENSKTMISKI
ncbi:MAG: helix-turn-helix domain-containing protein [candidate division WOR-3 bacterium]|nr:helix-turn-helix domain-containing protein [candidate division WOR-3 bacterium]MCX7836952.1 helix-turn-helix domain-containing protein [candidate division WOR-3 bacterium]MDW8114787.1 helix-turn-helix domain-containing protein [candidate division WOR-3 bacterium]